MDNPKSNECVANNIVAISDSINTRLHTILSMGGGLCPYRKF